MNENIKIGSDIHAGDGGYSIGNKEDYEAFVKVRNQSLGKARIKELMKEAGTDTSGKWMGIEHAEKLVMLVVKECIELNRQELAFNAFERMLNKYREHFGVEE